MKTSELTGALLDYWVARASGKGCWQWSDGKPVTFADWQSTHSLHSRFVNDSMASYRPSSDWAHGGPIIERERIKLMPTIPTAETWHATKCSSATLADMIVWRGKADTPLVAAMRCYVSQKFGDEVPHG